MADEAGSSRHGSPGGEADEAWVGELEARVAELTRELAAMRAGHAAVVAELTEQMAKIAPEIPSMSKEMVGAMREAVVVLKALQKTWLLKDESQEVRAAGASSPPPGKQK